ncbi:MAG: carotenoid oxygenase family protein [Acidimicrobiales bacterium]|nr:carotenoid oxygenase family protein [Acidimicrobiales bacterium]
MSVADVVQSLPWHLQGNYAPVPDEIDAFDLEAQGAIPRELEGRYLRNGANPKSGWSPHWFAGDGMIHGIRLQGGRAEWYRNRWVRTELLGRDVAMEEYFTEDGRFDHTLGVANTHVICHAGRIFALVESSFPTELTPELDTIGTWDFDGRLSTAMTAHPKICPETGEMHFFGYGFLPPYLTYHRADAQGNLVQTEVIDVPGSTMIHDFAVSRNHVVFLDLPVVFDLEEAARGSGMPYHWSDSYGARVGLMPRGGTAADLRWFEVDPCYVFHTMNAFDLPDGRVVVDVGRHEDMWRTSSTDFKPSYLYRWTFDPVSGTVHEEQLDDIEHGFPRVDDRKAGFDNRYGWAVAPRPGVSWELGGAPSLESASVIVKYDLAAGTSSTHDFGPAASAGEPVFVPASDDAGEDEGWVLTFTYDRSRDASDFVVLDAGDMAAPPVAVVPLPRRVPFGFHGSWVPDSRL